MAINEKHKKLMCYLYEYFYDVDIKKTNKRIIQELLEKNLDIKEEDVENSDVNIDNYLYVEDDEFDKEKIAEQIFIYPKTEFCEVEK